LLQLNKMLVARVWCGRNTTVWTRSQIMHHNAYLYIIRTVFCFCKRDVHGECGIINVHLFDILPAISSGKRLFFCPETGNPVSRRHSL